MTQPIHVLVLVALGVTLFVVLLFAIDQRLWGQDRVKFRYGAFAAATVGLFLVLNLLTPDDHDRVVGIAKSLIAILAAGAVFYEQHRIGQRRPIAERWKRFVGVALGIAAIIAYFNGFKFGYARYYHRWDQYHYYMGAKYFREMGYDGLYKCSVIAQNEIGTVQYDDEDHIGTGRHRLDMSKEVQHPDKKIRNLGGDNLLMPVTDILAHPEICKANFSKERWEAYKADVTFFRIASDKTYWEDMQKDHGYNPPPVWTVAGYYFASYHAAATHYLQFLASLDILYLGGMFVALWWAFGWRVFAVAAVLWGCQSPAPFLWTGGAFLRQDWLFYLVLSVCLIRKRYFVLAGAALVYSALLRVFPGLIVVGLLLPAGMYLWKHKRPAWPHMKMAAGGVLAAALLIPLSIHVSGASSYKQFYEHTLKVHDRTPLTNHMGLRVLISQRFAYIDRGIESGRMAYTKDAKRTDPFELWKQMRIDRYERYKPVAYFIIALSLAAFVYVARKVRSLWVSMCLAQIFMILGSQLTCYYYSFIILMAPLTRVRRELEAPIFAFAAVTQFVFLVSYWNDDKYWALTLVELLFCYGVLWVFLPLASRTAILAKLGQKKAVAAAPGAGPKAAA